MDDGFDLGGRLLQPLMLFAFHIPLGGLNDGIGLGCGFTPRRLNDAIRLAPGLGGNPLRFCGGLFQDLLGIALRLNTIFITSRIGNSSCTIIPPHR